MNFNGKIGMIALVSTLCLLGSYCESYAQNTVIRSSSNGCVGGSNTFTYPRSGCSVSWSATGNYTIISSNNNTLVIKWNAAIAGAFVSARYNCSTSPTSGTQNSSSFTISNPVTPGVALGLSTSTVCQGNGSIVLTATPTNGGTGPTYNWYVDGIRQSVGAANTFTYSTNSLTTGSHSVYVTMNVLSSLCVSSTLATSATQTFSVQAKSSFTVNVSGQSTICSHITSAGFTASIGDINGSYGNLTYQWSGGGGRLTGTPPNSYVISTFGQGTQISCIVSSDYWCVIPPVSSNTISINIQPSITISGAVSISPNKLIYCADEIVTFSANSSYLVPTSTYLWRKNGNVFSNSPTGTLIASTGGTDATRYKPGDVISLDVGGLSAGAQACLSVTSGTVTMTSQITINPLPLADIVPSGSLKIFSYATQPILAPSFAGYTYQWKKDGNIISGAAGIANPYQANASGTYSVVVTSSNGCTRESSIPLVLTINKAPIANAGPDQTIVLPSNTITLSLPGSGTDEDGFITGYLWEKVSGPSVILSNANSATLLLSELGFGEHTFTLKVTDDFGEVSAPDFVTLRMEYPPNNYNYIRESAVLIKDITVEGQLATLSVDQKSMATTYFDGLGRPMQSVSNQASPNPNRYDIVKPVVYDAYGREGKKYLPFAAGNNGEYKAGIIDPVTGNFANAAAGFYSNGTSDKIVDDTRYFTETVFEFSPLNRPLKEYGAGEGWKNQSLSIDKFIEHQYLVNTVSEVYLFNYDNATGLVSVLSGTGRFYEPGRLYVNKTIDEQQNEVIEYTDKKGRTVCKKVQVSGAGVSKVYASTYYVYDDLGNLVVVLPPEALSRFGL